ncbi:MAG: thiamine-binding protein [Candidatus Eremiobacteraeota bacterium]|nr:thiamine-binding protein [Candidatus Eremiobacteraeota bacterium]
MKISVEISFYPLCKENYSQEIKDFIDLLQESGVQAEVGRMSTIITGETARIFDLLSRGFENAASKGPAVMILKVSNACP